ncbi:hypothetical protein B9G39_16935 [Zooshikella ganghwensis]|uniref:Uncharacterized protein n=1 Tax=Zooshikella ganghwensis TaxID=202772 RepID=A0A4P9VNF7_9GAMM|nr:hypothetical protein B9G39_16935 [Zooshikella ganghwensis]
MNSLAFNITFHTTFLVICILLLPTVDDYIFYFILQIVGSFIFFKASKKNDFYSVIKNVNGKWFVFSFLIMVVFFSLVSKGCLVSEIVLFSFSCNFIIFGNYSFVIRYVKKD